MKKMRIRIEAGTTNAAVKAIPKINKLGEIHSVQGERFVSLKKIAGEFIPIQHEVVMIRGENGTARFKGFCWGYGGTGPNGLAQLLETIGLSKLESQHLAFKAPRNCTDGVDWSIRRDGDFWQVKTFTRSTKTEHLTWKMT